VSHHLLEWLFLCVRDFHSPLSAHHYIVCKYSPFPSSTRLPNRASSTTNCRRAASLRQATCWPPLPSTIQAKSPRYSRMLSVHAMHVYTQCVCVGFARVRAPNTCLCASRVDAAFLLLSLLLLLLRLYSPFLTSLFVVFANLTLCFYSRSSRSAARLTWWRSPTSRWKKPRLPSTRCSWP